MRNTLIDTGPMYAFLREEDRKHAPSMDAIQGSLSAGRFLTTTWEVISETYTLIRRRLAKEDESALAALQLSRTLEVIDIDASSRRRAHAILKLHKQLRLSYVDALLLAIAERHRIEEIITLDGEMAAVRLSYPVLISVVV